MVTLYLETEQKTHLKQLARILEEHPGCGDTSPCGSGKTVTTIALSLELNLILFVVCPKSMKSKWERECSKYGVGWAEIINYEAIGTTKSEWVVQNNKKYAPSDKMITISQQGILLVFDEVQYVKNSDSNRSKAAFALVRSLSGTVSRSCFLSNTPFAKESFGDSILRILGIITSERLLLYNRTSMTYSFKGYGLSQLMGYCRRINSKMVDLIKQKFLILDNRNKNDICFHLYKRILRPALVSSMSEPNNNCRLTIYNAFYNMGTEALSYINKGYDMIKGRVGDTGKNFHNFGKCVAAQTLIEKGKLIKLKQIVKKRLKENPNLKIIVYLHRISSMEEMKKEFSEYGALMMNSKVTGKQRDQVIENFQRSDNRYRLLINSTGVGGVGLDLDDQDGNYPREVYIIPGYKYIDDYQGARRVKRRFTKSDANVYFMYSSNILKEKVLLNQIKKSQIHSKVVNSISDMVKTVEHETYYEE